MPPKREEEQVACLARIHVNRDLDGRLSARLEGWRTVAIRYDGTATSCLGVLRLAATLDRLKRHHLR